MKQKNKKSVRVKGVKGYGPRHMMNAQEGSEAVPSDLPGPPDWVEEARRRVAAGQGMKNLTPGLLGGLTEAGGQLAGMSKEDVAKLAISMLAGGEGEAPLPETPGAVPAHVWQSWKPTDIVQGHGGEIKIDPAGNYYQALGTHQDATTGQWHAIVKPVEAPAGEGRSNAADFKPGGKLYKPGGAVGDMTAEFLGEEPPEEILPSPSGKSWGNINDLTGDIPLTTKELQAKHQDWLDAQGKDFQVQDDGSLKPVAPRVSEGPLSAEDQADADYLNALKRKDSLGQLPQPGPLDRPYLPPEGFKRGKVAVAKGFGPAHAENSKEGEDLTKVNTDTVPAMLTPRESVLNRNASELAGRDNIEKLNSEGNKLAKKGVDLAAGGMADVKEKIMKSKPKSSKPGASGSPYVQAFQNLMPKGGAPVGYQGGGDSVPGMGGGLGARDQYGRQFSNRDASGGFASGNGVPGAGVPGGPYGTRNDTGPGVIGGPMGGGPFPGRGPGGVYPGGGYQPAGVGVGGTPGGPFPGRGPGGVYPGGPMATPLADGTSNVGPIGTPPQGEQAYGPPVNLTAPQIQRLAQQTGISPGQIMGLVKAFQGGKDIYNSVGTGGYDTASPATSQAVGDAFGFGAEGMQGGISDIGYPPFVAPSASYDGNRGGWLGPYDPSFMIQRYAGGTSYVSPFR